LPYAQGADVLLNVEGKDGRRSGRGHVDPAACTLAGAAYRKVGGVGVVEVFEHIEAVIVGGVMVFRRVGGTNLLISTAGRVSEIGYNEAGVLQDGGIVAAITAGDVRAPSGGERIFQADRISPCADCGGLIRPGDWLLWERGKGSRHLIGSRCVPGAWSSKKVRGLGTLWRSPSGEHLVSEWGGTRRTGFRRDYRDATPEEVLAFGTGDGEGGLEWVFKDLNVQARTEKADFLRGDLEPGAAPGSN
jgi:hypothetical protein